MSLKELLPSYRCVEAIHAGEIVAVDRSAGFVWVSPGDGGQPIDIFQPADWFHKWIPWPGDWFVLRRDGEQFVIGRGRFATDYKRGA